MSLRIAERRYPTNILQRRSYYLAGKYHREDGPAIESFYKDGTLHTRRYYLNGALHRIDGPAYEKFHKPDTFREWAAGSNSYYTSEESSHGHQSTTLHHISVGYYLYGECLSKHEHQRQVALLKLSMQLSNDYGVTI